MDQRTVDVDVKTKVKTIARFWAELLKNSPQHDIGNSVQNAIANSLAGKSVFTDDQVERFQEELERLMELTPSDAEMIVVDYHPDLILERAAQSAGIDIKNRLPIKTATRMSRMSYVTGYNGKIQHFTTDMKKPGHQDPAT